jgi:glycosyltransferase involved in cell wall biosynthesis
MLNKITPVVITFDEAANIGRCLDMLRWADKVLILDSYSTDETTDICRKYDNVILLKRNFTGFADQCNFAIRSEEIKTEWVLALDADYILSKDIVSEISKLNPPESIGGYETRFVYCIDGRPIRGSLYPPVTTLFRKNIANYRQDGHAHRVDIKGETGQLTSEVFHDDRKSRERWIASQQTYCRQEADKLRATPFTQLGLTDKIRRVPGLSLILLVPYLALIKGLVFDGAPGWTYIKQRVYAEALLQRALLMPARTNPL